MGETPHSAIRCACRKVSFMKACRKRKAPTLGELIESAYRSCGKHRAIGILRLAAEARLLVFQKSHSVIGH